MATAPTKPSIRPNTKQRQELIDDLIITLAYQLKAFGIAEEVAGTVSEQVACHIQKHFGGQLIYMPMLTPDLAQRDADIVRQFTGDNHAELSREFGLSMAHIYRILKKQESNACIKNW